MSPSDLRAPAPLTQSWATAAAMAPQDMGSQANSLSNLARRSNMAVRGGAWWTPTMCPDLLTRLCEDSCATRCRSIRDSVQAVCDRKQARKGEREKRRREPKEREETKENNHTWQEKGGAEERKPRHATQDRPETQKTTDCHTPQSAPWAHMCACMRMREIRRILVLARHTHTWSSTRTRAAATPRDLGGDLHLDGVCVQHGVDALLAWPGCMWDAVPRPPSRCADAPHPHPARRSEKLAGRAGVWGRR